MRKIFLTLLIISQLSCTSISYKSAPTSEEKFFNLSKTLASKSIIEEDSCFLIFTRDFNSQNLKVKVDGNIIYNGKISTNGYRVAEVIKVKMNSNIEIYLEGISKQVKISAKQYRNYKYIYVEKNNRKIVVEFNDSSKSLKGKWNSPNAY